MTRAALREGHIDLWYVRLDGFGEADRSACLALLSRSERERFDGFKVESAKTQFLAARGLVRTTLSRYAPIPPDRWRFTTNRYGRPLIEDEPEGGGLYFSLSHTRGLVACAVGSLPEMGIDVEFMDRPADLPELARAMFTAREAARLDRARPDQKASVFFTLWTLKEAYIKARGMGLSLPLDGFWFDIDAAPPTVRFTEAVADDPRTWAFRTLAPTADHVMAVAARLASPALALTIRPRETGAINAPDAAKSARGRFGPRPLDPGPLRRPPATRT